MQSTHSMLRVFLIIFVISGSLELGEKVRNAVVRKPVVVNAKGKADVKAKPIPVSKIQAAHFNNKYDLFKPVANFAPQSKPAPKQDFTAKVEERLNGWMVGLKDEITSMFGKKKVEPEVTQQLEQPEQLQQSEQSKLPKIINPVVITVTKPKVIVTPKPTTALPVFNKGLGLGKNRKAMAMDKGVRVQPPIVGQKNKPVVQPAKDARINGYSIRQKIKDAQNAIQAIKPTDQIKPKMSVQNPRVENNKSAIKLNPVEDSNKTVAKNPSAVLGDEPIQIVWEIGSLKTELAKVNRSIELSFIKQMMSKTDSLLKMYVKIPKEKQQLIRLVQGQRCGFNLPKDIVTNAHVLMLTRFFTPKVADEQEVVARSIYCQKNSNNRAVVGVLEINLLKLITEQDSLTARMSFVTTLFHEVMHTLAFYGDWNAFLVKREIKKDLPNLGLIKRVNPQIWDEGHWKDPYMTHEIMSPYTSNASIVSIFTLEVLEHQSSEYSVERKNLPYDNFLSTVTSVEDFLSYKCPDTLQKPKYAEFCSQSEVKNDVRKCSTDYVHKTYCDEHINSNNCYQRRMLSHGNCLDTIVDPQYPDYAFEHRGSDSRCFMDEEELNSFCLKYEVADQKINLIIGSASYVCEADDQVLSVRFVKSNNKGYNFTVKCPKIAHFIDQNNKTSCPNNCHWNGFCSKGQCLCFDGYSAHDNCKTPLRTLDQTMIFIETMA